MRAVHSRVRYSAVLQKPVVEGCTAQHSTHSTEQHCTTHTHTYTQTHTLAHRTVQYLRVVFIGVGVYHGRCDAEGTLGLREGSCHNGGLHADAWGLRCVGEGGEVE
jgi:hypothetical protein